MTVGRQPDDLEGETDVWLTKRRYTLLDSLRKIAREHTETVDKLNRLERRLSAVNEMLIQVEIEEGLRKPS